MKRCGGVDELGLRERRDDGNEKDGRVELPSTLKIFRLHVPPVAWACKISKMVLYAPFVQPTC